MTSFCHIFEVEQSLEYLILKRSTEEVFRKHFPSGVIKCFCILFVDDCLEKNYMFLFLSVLQEPQISVVVTSVGFVAPENR